MTSGPILCSDFRPQLDALLDGKLDLIQGFRVNGHLRACEACRAVYHDKRRARIASRRWLPRNCRHLSDVTIGEQREGRLDAEEVVVVREHLGNCPACRERFSAAPAR